jgi:hypothetical protein
LGIKMDINLTHPLEANIYLLQPWWIALINIAAGILGALIGASAVLVAEHIGNERAIIKQIREERRISYLKILNSMNYYILSDNFPKDDERDFIRSTTELSLVGSQKIRDKIATYLDKNCNDINSIKNLRDEITPLMREEMIRSYE